MGKPKKGKGSSKGSGSGGKKKGKESPLTSAAGADDASTSSPSASSSRPPVPGLVNLGNTCFFNSALQVLASAPLVQDHYGAPGAAGAGGPLGRAFAAAVAALGVNGPKGSTSHAPVYNPSPLLAAVCKVAPQFKGRQQQDSHELLRFLLDGVRAEEEKAAGGGGKASKKSSSPAPLPDPAASPSFAERVFGGQLASAVACGCGSASTTLEPFMDLSLPVPPAAVVSRGDAEAADPATPTLVLRPPKKEPGPAPPLTAKQAKRAAKAAAQAAKAKAKADKEEEKVEAEAAPPPPAPSPPPPPPPLGPPGAAPPPPAEDEPEATLAIARESFASELGEDVTSPTHSAGGGLSDGLGGASAGPGALSAADSAGATFHTPASVLADSGVGMASGGSGPAGASPPSVGMMSADGRAEGSAAATAAATNDDDDISRLYAAPEPPAAALSSSSDSDGEPADGDAAGMAGLCSLFDSATNLDKKGKGEGGGDDSPPGTPTLAPASSTKPRGGGGLFGSLAAFARVGGDGGGDALDAEAAPGTDLAACLAAFFAPEPVEWECPAAAAARKENKGAAEAAPQANGHGGDDDAASTSSPSSSSSAASFGTPAAGVVSHGLSDDDDDDQPSKPPPPTRPSMRRSVSFCEAGPRVKLIPGSAEQRGTNFAAALRGDDHFVRPLRFGGACLMVTAHVDSGGGANGPAPWEGGRDKLHVEVHRQDDEPASLAALPASLAVASVDIDSVDDSDDEAEQARVRSAAQALMDCVADAVAATGSVDGMRRMVADGLSLARVPAGAPTGEAATSCGGWKVKGVTPGEGPWMYPAAAAAHPSAAASPDGPAGVSIPARSKAAEAAVVEDGATDETSPRSAALSHFAGPGSPPVGGWMEKVLGKSGNGGTGAPPPPFPAIGNGVVGGGAEPPADAAGVASSSKGTAAPPASALANGTAPADDARAAGSSTKAAKGEGEGAAAAAATEPAPPSTSSTHSGSHKRYCLHRAPPLLTLHLKRFERDARGRFRKLGGHVAFPLVLEAGDVLPSAACQTSEKKGASSPSTPAKKAASPPTHSGPTYDLVGVVEHLGSMRGGHYVAYVRREKEKEKWKKGGGGGGAAKAQFQWFRASDTVVSPVSEAGVLGCEAYLLLYARRDEEVE